jgi:glycosyltransferase involved in cell wall biosynthesis
MSILNLPVDTMANLEAADNQETLEVSVIMPCLNEGATVGTCVTKALQAIQSLNLRGEVVVGDNGSTDGSQQIARAHGARVISVEKYGYGAALQGAMAAARGRFVVMGDSDDSYDFAQIGVFLDKLREGYDLVIGNRFSGKILPGAMPSLHRYAGNPILSGVGRLFFKSPIGDFHCGLRAFRRKSIEQLRLQMLGMEFASEMIVKATIFGLRLTEIPTTLAPDGRLRASHLRTWRDGWRHLRFLLVYSPRWLFLYPGALIFALGIVATFWLLPGPRTISNVTFDVDTLLFSAMAILVGFQSIIFAAFTEVFAVTQGLLPQDVRFAKFFQHAKLETGLIVGMALFLVGVGMWVAGLRYWSSMHFGPLNPTSVLRIVIPGILCLTLGFQIILSSFFLSVLSMERQDR